MARTSHHSHGYRHGEDSVHAGTDEGLPLSLIHILRNFLGITRHLSTTAGYAKRIGWLLREDVTQSPFPDVYKRQAMYPPLPY